MSARGTTSASERQRECPDVDKRRQPGTPSLVNGLKTVHPAPFAFLLRVVQSNAEASHLRPFVARQILTLQRTHGNQYVGRLLKRNGCGRPSAAASNAYVAQQAELAPQQDWGSRVTAARGLRGEARDQAYMDLITEALGGSIIVHRGTNAAATVKKAIKQGRYVEWGAMANVNFDWNLNQKSGAAGAYGITINVGKQIYITLGRRAVGKLGPEITRMAYEHEAEHAQRRILELVIEGKKPLKGKAPPAEELAIYTEGFIHHILDLVSINIATREWRIGDDFRPLFHYYKKAPKSSKEEAFGQISDFYEVRVQRVPDNLRKFKVWLQSVRNALPAKDPLVNRINQLEGLGLTRGEDPAKHISPEQGP